MVEVSYVSATRFLTEILFALLSVFIIRYHHKMNRVLDELHLFREFYAKLLGVHFGAKHSEVPVKVTLYVL